ncbi:hypothetical protein V1293_002267 [Bradyrhizobium sp. AZCC 1693]
MERIHVPWPIGLPVPVKQDRSPKMRPYLFEGAMGPFLYAICQDANPYYRRLLLGLICRRCW